MFAIKMSSYARGQLLMASSKNVNVINELAVCSTRDNESLTPNTK